jgi:hypothetical protein
MHEKSVVMNKKHIIKEKKDKLTKISNKGDERKKMGNK